MIQVKDIKKNYGQLMALDGLSMTIPNDSCYGFVGPNGAGKTTTIQILLGLLYPEEGTVLIDDMEAGSHVRRLKKRIGYVPDYMGIYPNIRVGEYMDFFASCYDLYGARTHRRIEMLLDMVGMKGRERQMVDTLSRGMQQKLSLARALIHDPKILILDEPTAGLDPGTRYEYKRMITELQDDGKTILISSHILTDISEICTDVGIIDQGKMVMEGRLSDVLKKVNSSSPIIISIEGSLTGAMSVLKEDRHVRSISIRAQEILISYDGSPEEETALLATLIKGGIPVRSFHREKGNLEALFMQLTGLREERTVINYDTGADI